MFLILSLILCYLYKKSYAYSQSIGCSDVKMTLLFRVTTGFHSLKQVDYKGSKYFISISILKEMLILGHWSVSTITIAMVWTLLLVSVADGSPTERHSSRNRHYLTRAFAPTAGLRTQAKSCTRLGEHLEQLLFKVHVEFLEVKFTNP